MTVKISIIIPSKNEAEQITKTLASLLPFRQEGHEIILVDAHSDDQTQKLAYPFCDKIISCSEGRSTQMNKGAEIAKGEVLLFLHADTRLPKNSPQLIQQAIDKKEKGWGCFNVRLSGIHFIFRIIAMMMNIRSYLTGISTGDQALFIKKTLFDEIGGFPNIPLMEDIALSKSLKKISSPVRIKEKLLTSSRRWEKNGIGKTILLMWGIRLGYFFGVSPQKLKNYYQ